MSQYANGGSEFICAKNMENNRKLCQIWMRIENWFPFFFLIKEMRICKTRTQCFGATITTTFWAWVWVYMYPPASTWHGQGRPSQKKKKTTALQDQIYFILFISILPIYILYCYSFESFWWKIMSEKLKSNRHCA